MPNLAAPLKIEEFAHADANAVEYLLDEKTGVVWIQPVGAACKVSTSPAQIIGNPISQNFLPVSDGGLEPFSFSRPGDKARTPGRRIVVALDAPGTLKILSARG